MNSSSVATTIEQPGKIMLTQELEDDQVGPVFVELPDQMGWVNNFSACDQCARVMLSAALQGLRLGVQSRIPSLSYLQAGLPPPAAAPPSPPDSSPTEGYRFQWESLVQKLTWLQRGSSESALLAMPWRDEPSLEEIRITIGKRFLTSASRRVGQVDQTRGNFPAPGSSTS
ncbi:hypothetical protein H4Q26_005004 [Puccinia striiformis f. sp. tritici PST-130]|nr:hypothetical protein H4Q26_005004 [Puccinia striiformis f. sp. tritici PST-130]